MYCTLPTHPPHTLIHHTYSHTLPHSTTHTHTHSHTSTTHLYSSHALTCTYTSTHALPTHPLCTFPTRTPHTHFPYTPHTLPTLTPHTHSPCSLPTHRHEWNTSSCRTKSSSHTSRSSWYNYSNSRPSVCQPKPPQPLLLLLLQPPPHLSPLPHCTRPQIPLLTNPSRMLCC